MHYIWSFVGLRLRQNNRGLTEDRATVGTDLSADQGPRRMRGLSSMPRSSSPASGLALMR